MTSISINEKNEISIYKDSLTRNHVKAECLKIRTAFPSLEKHFTDLLTEALVRNNFTNQRFTDAKNYVIDNHVYPKPSIAEFISYDKKVKTYTHKEACEVGMEYLQSTDVGIGVCVWTDKQDFKNYGLKEWKPKQ